MFARFSTAIRVLMCVAALMIPVASQAQTGAIRGLVKTSSGQICGEDEVRAQMQGSSASAREYDYGRIYWDGIYQIPEAGSGHDGRAPNMLPGTYAVGMSDEYEWRPRNYSNIKVQNGVITPCNITVPETYGIRNQDGLTGSYTNVGQTFVATGGSLQRMTLWHVPVACRITVRQGGPAGPVVGSPRDIGANAPTVTWMYGEIPTVAGQTYYIDFYASSGFQTYRRSGNPYPSGTAYYNGVAQSNIDLMMTLFEDCDGQASMYHVHLSGTSTNNFYATAGQTFKARGSNILSVSLRFRTGGGSKTAICTIHQGGPGGAQIGPSKATTVYDYNPVGQKVTFCWLPGEVPVTNGQTYYLRVATTDGLGLYTWCSSNSVYPDGQAYSWDSPWGGDVIGTIMGEVSPGSSTCTIYGTVRDADGNPVNLATISADNCGYSTTTAADGTYSLTVTGDVYDLTCAKSGYLTKTVNDFNAVCGTSAQLNWTLPFPGRLLGYVRDTQGNGIVGATVSMSPGGYSAVSQNGGYYSILNVEPGTYNVTASRAGYLNQAKSGIVITQGNYTQCDFALSPQASLNNWGFEEGNSGDNPPIGWTKYGHGLAVRTGTGYGGITPHGGSRYAEIGASWTDPKTGGLYQSVWVPLGLPAIATAWVTCYGESGGAAHTFGRIGVDPAGGVNPSSASIQWSAWYNAPADDFKEWVQLSKSVMTSGNLVTIFLDYVQQPNGDFAYQWQVNGFDDVAIGGPTTSTLVEARQAAENSYVYFEPAVITAKFSGTPNFFYVEDPDRVAGLRVNGDTSYVVGDKVRVGGTIKTAVGERYVTLGAVELIQSGFGYLVPIGMANWALGGGSNAAVPGVTDGIGTNNIGLLVTAWGRVTHIDTTTFYLTDGSGVTVKVAVPSTSDMPANSAYAIVTGVSSTFDAGGGNIGRLLRAKSGGVVAY